MLKLEEKQTLPLFGGTIVGTSTSASISADLPPLPPGEEIYDLMPVVNMAIPWKEYLVYVLATIIALWLLFLLYGWLISEPVRKRKVLQSDPEKMAIRAIERLKLSPVWHKQQMKEICETLVYILKSFLFEKYRIGIGPAATSDEMLQILVDSKAKPELRKQVNELFDVCDRIKFMGQKVEISPEDLAETVAALVRDQGWQK